MSDGTTDPRTPRTQRSAWRRVWVWFVVIPLGAVGVVFVLPIALFLDSLGPAMWIPLPFQILAWALGLAVAWGSWVRWKGWRRLVGLPATLLILGVFTPWNPRKLFVFRLARIDTGMTVDEVEEIMGGYMKGRGAKWGAPASAYPTGGERSTATGSMTYRWSDDGAWDSDWGVVTFADGRVTKVRFMPD